MATNFTFGDSFLNAYIGAQQRAQQQKQFDDEMNYRREQAKTAVEQFNKKFGFDVDRAKVGDQQWQQNHDLALKNYGLNEQTTKANIANMESDNARMDKELNWKISNYGKPSPYEIMNAEAMGYTWDGTRFNLAETEDMNYGNVVDLLTNASKGTPKDQFDPKAYVENAIKNIRRKSTQTNPVNTQSYGRGDSFSFGSIKGGTQESNPEIVDVANSIDPIFKEADDIVSTLEKLASKKRLSASEQSLAQSLLASYYSQYEDTPYSYKGEDNQDVTGTSYGQLSKINQYLQQQGYNLPAFSDYQANLRGRLLAIGQKLDRLNKYVDVNKGEKYYK